MIADKIITGKKERFRAPQKSGKLVDILKTRYLLRKKSASA